MRVCLGNLGQMYSNTLFIANLFAFLDLEPTLVDAKEGVPAPTSVRQGILFRDVTFHYPGSQRPALENLDLFLPAGRVVALVGPNGSGKTTLLKLLCRFYDPTAGSIEIDGTDIRRFRLVDLRRLITVLFQFPTFYQESVRRSIELGDIEHSFEPEEIETAARQAGAHDVVTRLARGYDTQLGKWFGVDGAELSGGEWQRIAMARAFLRSSPIILLDEPTSHMDSWAEADWLERFRVLGAQRTSLIITHRFTIAIRADIIHVMDNGHIVESGSHQELLALDGLYARSWAAQVSAAGHDTAAETISPSSAGPPSLLSPIARV